MNVNKSIVKHLVFLAIFIALGVDLALIAPTVEIAWVSTILLLTVYLFAFEVVEVDVAAITIMVILGLTGLIAPVMGLKEGLVPASHLFDGFSSNAVMSIIAVMIIGAGLDRTGIMSKVATFIMRMGGSTEKRIIPLTSGAVAFISSFMQNVGAAALFLPVVSRISGRTGLPMSRLLMPMGFCAILGGTMTMVGSSPLILLNDLILTSNKTLPADQQMESFGLFSVTPIGFALVVSGIAYFMLVGRYVLPVVKNASGKPKDAMSYFRDVYHLDYELAEIVVPKGSPLVNMMLDEVEVAAKIRVIAAEHHGHMVIGPGGLARDFGIEGNTILGVMAETDRVAAFVKMYGLTLRPRLRTFAESLGSTQSGIAEIVIPPGSSIVGKSARDIWLRKTYGTALVAIHRQGTTLQEDENDLRSIKFQAGDTLVVHVTWEALARLEHNNDFLVVTTDFPHENLRPKKVPMALLFFAITLGLVLFTDLRLSIALLSGALGMVLTGVLKIEEAYKAVSWSTVFLLASLIPLGLAVQSSGTAAWIADQTLVLLGDMPIWVIQAAIALLATFFTLVMSNVGATVLLVPLAVNIAIGAGANPAVFALTVAIATSNSFLIPTHQVNALIMGPAGYRVPDFMRAGGIMTILFLVVSLVMLNLVF